MTCPVSVIIPTWNRLDDLIRALARIESCQPAPAEIIVHVDAGDSETAPWLHTHRPDIRVLQSKTTQGPGGGRNKLLNAVSQPFAASFDDDSYPHDDDYFARVADAFQRHPNAGILAASINHQGEPPPELSRDTHLVSSFVGCGCAYRMDAWKDVSGYIPLALAYGMEEADLSLQCIDANWEIVHDKRLRVFHDTDLSHHASASKTAAAITNRALLAFLRYPLSHLWLGVAQFINRIRWSLQAGRIDGVLKGITQTPATLWRYRMHRAPISQHSLAKAKRLAAASLREKHDDRLVESRSL